MRIHSDGEFVYAPEWNALVAAEAGNAMRSGGVVTESAPPAMSVDVAEGDVLFADAQHILEATTLSIAAADATNPRWDLVTVEKIQSASDDSSGNGHHFTTFNFDRTGAAPSSKYGGGVIAEAGGGSSLFTDFVSGLVETGDLAMAVVFTLPGATPDGTEIIMGGRDDGGGVIANILVFTDGSIRYAHTHSTGLFEVFSSAGVTVEGENRVYVTRDVSAQSVRVVHNGTEIINTTWGGGEDPVASSTASLRHFEGSDETEIGIFESRFWKSGNVPSDAVLDQIIDPNDNTHEGVAEGNEEALYFFESIADARVTTGTPAADPATPAIPAGDVLLALVDVQANVTEITDADILDGRVLRTS